MIDLKISIPFSISVIRGNKEWHEFQEPIQSALKEFNLKDFYNRGWRLVCVVGEYPVYGRLIEATFEFITFQEAQDGN